MAEKRRNFVKFIWKVENFSFCWNEKDDFLESPTFSFNFEGSPLTGWLENYYFWCLKLYPRGKTSYEKYISVDLVQSSSREGSCGITIDIEITLLRRNGETEYIRRMEDKYFLKGQELSLDNLIARDIILGRKKSVLLPEDTLTLQCCIFPKDAELRYNREVIVKTHIEVECYRYKWKDFDCSSLQGSEAVTFHCEDEENIVSFDLSKTKESYYHPEILSLKFLDARNLKSMHFKIRVLDSKESVVKLLENHIYHDSSSEGPLFFPVIAVSELMKNKSLCHPNGKLNLDCDFTLCYGLQNSQIEAIAQNTTFMFVPIDETSSTCEIGLPRKKFLYCNDNISSLKNDIQNLYKEGTFCDFTIKVGEKNFKVHKIVLCAKSPVFKAMMTNNLRENQKNLVEISDLEEDTVDRMLTFMYSGMADDLDWDTAKKLYFAADKYDLIALKRICSEELKQNLSVTNVKEVLELADNHSDDNLKKICSEFICNQETQLKYLNECTLL